jgi:hypothetical protein
MVAEGGPERWEPGRQRAVARPGSRPSSEGAGTDHCRARCTWGKAVTANPKQAKHQGNQRVSQACANGMRRGRTIHCPRSRRCRREAMSRQRSGVDPGAGRAPPDRRSADPTFPEAPAVRRLPSWRPSACARGCPAVPPDLRVFRVYAQQGLPIRQAANTVDESPTISLDLSRCPSVRDLGQASDQFFGHPGAGDHAGPGTSPGRSR